MQTRAVVLAMVAVVASFTATVSFSQVRLVPIGERVENILGDAMPSMEHLSGVETELNLLGLRTNEYVDAAPSERTVLREQIAATRQRIGVEFDSYRMLPRFPGEASETDRVIADLATVDDAREIVMRHADAGSLAAANYAMRTAFDPRLERTAQDVAAVRASNAAYIRSSNAHILEARQGARRAVFALGATSVVVAILATILVVRMLRSRARVVHEHSELLATRASEMEAFAGRVAHDLRNPLAAMTLWLAAAQDPSEHLSPRARGHLRKASMLTDRMSNIIDGLLAFARAGANPDGGGSADLGAVLDDVLTEVVPLAESAHVDVQVAEFPPTMVACEPPALASVLANLLGNALKYGAGAHGPARILVRVDAGDDAAHVEVADNGPGLPSGSEQRIFEPFRQLAGGCGGIGLGLATVKKLVEAHGGRVGVRSTPGHGSTCWFELPRAA